MNRSTYFDARAAVCAAVATAALIALRGDGLWFRVEALPWLLLPALLGWVAWRFRSSAEGEPSVSASGWILLGALFLYLFTSATQADGFFLLKWLAAPSAPLLKPMFVRWLLLTLAFGLILLFAPRLRPALLPGLMVFGLVATALALHGATGFRPFYGDDHPAFMHRLWVFAQSFPHGFYYDPSWNGGRVATFLVASGVLAPALVLLPLLKMFPIDQVYTPGLAILFLVLVPWVAYGSLRAAGASRTAAGCAALLALGTSGEFLKWLLHFGTLGSTFAGAFALPVAALLYRVLMLQRRDAPTFLALVAASCLFLAWPGYWVISLALLPAIVLTLPRWSRSTWLFVAACAVPILLFVEPMMYGVSTRTDIAGFAAKATLTDADTQWLSNAWPALAARLRGLTPILLFLGVLGSPFLSDTPARRFITAAGGGFLFFSLCGGWVPGGLNVERALVPLGFLSIWPAALWCDAVLRGAASPARVVASAMLLALLATHAYSVGRYYGNEAPASYRVLTPETRAFMDWLQERTDPDQRILFGGMTLHAYGGGHVAVLPALLGREMIAADYYHFSPKLVEYFAPPRSFRLKDDDVLLYTDIMNAGYVIGYDEASILRFYRKYPDLYEELGTFPGPLPKTLFRVRRESPSWFLQNSGTVSARVNRIEVTLDDPQQDAVIKYRYSPELRAENGVELFPHSVRDHEFIGIRPHGAQHIVIRHGRFW